MRIEIPDNPLAWHRVEYHRNGLAFFPDSGDKNPGVVMWVRGDTPLKDSRACTCKASRRTTCLHLVAFSRLQKCILRQNGKRDFDEKFRQSHWHKMAEMMYGFSRETPENVSLKEKSEGDAVTAYNAAQEPLLVLHAGLNADQPREALEAQRFVDRCCPESTSVRDCPRGVALSRLVRMTLSENERLMLDRGMKTRRLALEASFWYRVAYHGFRTCGEADGRFEVTVDDVTGEVGLVCLAAGGGPLYTIPIQRRHVPRFLASAKSLLRAEEMPAVLSTPLQSQVRMRLDAKQNLELRLNVAFENGEGHRHVYDRSKLRRFQYEHVYYLKAHKLFARMETPDRLLEKFGGRYCKTVKKEKIPFYLEKFGADLWQAADQVDDTVRNLKIHKTFDRMEISPEAADRDWYWLSIEYGFGDDTVSLGDILEARRKRIRFISVKDGWVDSRAVPLGNLTGVRGEPEASDLDPRSGRLKMKPMDLYRLQAATENPLKVKPGAQGFDQVSRMLEMKPVQQVTDLKEMTCELRSYQKKGVAWLAFLFEQRFGGLLCDDMGLGKTHQAMALMVWLLSRRAGKGPCLVVCPTTVLSHWCNKLQTFAPVLSVREYYGGERNLAQDLQGVQVLLTSYGILRRDMEQLARRRFYLVIFDEAQYLKNPGTQVYTAAQKLAAEVKIGLTGTPIENRLEEIKSLMDLVLPGYLGSDTDFEIQFVRPAAINPKTERLKDLSRLIGPFTLRRSKEFVLPELPDKIEDIRTCRLSETQVKLYRDIVDTRAKGFIRDLQDQAAAIPYIHIFAVLNLLKQICDHPALLNDPEGYQAKESGKWELFKELLQESLDSGQKVVVYSQYLGMVQIIEDYLQTQEIEAVTLTGATRNRGQHIERFNTDPDCRVFVGSLKAGGIGIDLTAASVVIHYDRWWNAAREDQATDRVHRFGQHRGVQVFKLVTTGTLEEKISAIIEKKRSLMKQVVREDDPGLLKAFTRDQLMALLSFSDGITDAQE